MKYQHILFEETEPGLGLLTLNRPERLNAVSFPMLEEILALFARLEGDKKVRVIAITGAGRSFCSGADLFGASEMNSTEIPNNAAELLETVQKPYSRLVLELRRLPQPVIAAVNGPAAGIGMSIALASDIIIGTPETSFIASFANLGLSGGELGTSYLLPRLIGRARAADILLTGRKVKAEEAERIGMFAEFVERDRLMETCMERARMMLKKSPYGLRLTKETLEKNANAPSLSAAVELENRNQSILAFTPEFLQAIMEFGSKKKS